MKHKSVKLWSIIFTLVMMVGLMPLGQVLCADYKDGQTLSNKKTSETNPLPGKYFITWIVGNDKTTVELTGPYTGNETYPYSVPQSLDCHYQMDWWSDPVTETVLRFEDGKYYTDTVYTKTMVYKPKTFIFRKAADEVPATCTEPGINAYWKCLVCGRMYSDANGKNQVNSLAELQSDPLGHDWAIDTAQGENGWTWNSDNSRATAHFKCQRESCEETTSVTIVCDPKEGGTATLSVMKTETGTQVTVTPNENNGYIATDITCFENDSEKPVNVSNTETSVGGVSSGTFEIPTEPVTVTVKFVKTYNIAVNAPVYGNYLDVQSSATAGKTVTIYINDYNFISSGGYIKSASCVGGTDETPVTVTIADNGNSCSFTMPDQNVIVNVEVYFPPVRLTKLDVAVGTLPQTLAPCFAPETTAYSVTVPYEVEELNLDIATDGQLSFTASDWATLHEDTKVVGAGYCTYAIQGTVALDVGKKIVQVRAEATQGDAPPTDYTLTITRLPENVAAYELWIGHTQVTDLNKDDILNDNGSVKYNPASGVLILDNPNITTVGPNSAVIYCSEDKPLTVKGTADLNVDGADYGIRYQGSGNLTIDGDISASGVQSGIFAPHANINITGGTVNADGRWIGIAGGDNSKINIENSIRRVLALGSNTAMEAGGGITLGNRLNFVREEYSPGYYTEADRLSSDSTYTVKDNDSRSPSALIAPATCIVTFDANGYGTAPATQTVENGKTATKPANPKESRWRFDGWYTEAECINAFDFTNLIIEDITLYAKWTKPGGSTTKYTLTYNTNGGKAIASARHYRNTTVNLTVKPTREGYTFTGWYDDAALTNKVTSVRMNSDKTVYAGWKEANSNTSVHNCPSAYLMDVDINQWYHEYIDYVLEKGLMQGVAANQFAPSLTTTRAMIVTILYRLEGKPAVSGTNPFDDVVSGHWYADAVIWASNNGIVDGYGYGKFGPMDNITREQMAVILYRYANFKGYDTSVGQDTNILSYDDAFDISDWAMEAMQWACGAGLITGRTKSTIVPAGDATRAEVAAILMRFIENVK